jgi:adenine-specific DNA-methyltransferase
MGDYQCAKCSKVFVQKGHYEKHLVRKIPCKPPLLKKQPKSKEFRDVSDEFNKTLTKTYRQDNGIFFTPLKVRNRVFEILDMLNCNPQIILEPSFGSGEFLQDLYSKYPKSIIYGVEKDSKLFNSMEKTNTLFNEDFLEFKNCNVDLIIGNPPYFNISIKNSNCMTGHGNIYILFIYKCLTEHLNDNGILAFVLPTSLYNSSYYEPCRKYIAENNTILHLENLDTHYFETTQKTMLLVLKKGKENDDYLFKRADNIYITPYFKELNRLIENTTTLNELGFKIKTGEVVWNQEKNNLSDTDGTLVIYTSNIINNKLVLNNLSGEKKQYIQNFKKPLTKGPAIVISRGYGNNYRFSFTVVEDIEFYGENHINVVSGGKDIHKVTNSFNNKKTEEFIKYFVGNGALSKTELEYILPIF